jgi:hypothetical protein
MNATGVEWETGKGRDKVWYAEIRWPMSTRRNTVRIKSNRSGRDCWIKAKRVLDVFNLKFVTGWIRVASADYAAIGHDVSSNIYLNGEWPENIPLPEGVEGM